MFKRDKKIPRKYVHELTLPPELFGCCYEHLRKLGIEVEEYSGMDQENQQPGKAKHRMAIARRGKQSVSLSFLEEEQGTVMLGMLVENPRQNIALAIEIARTLTEHGAVSESNGLERLYELLQEHET